MRGIDRLLQPNDTQQIGRARHAKRRTCRHQNRPARLTKAVAFYRCCGVGDDLVQIGHINRLRRMNTPYQGQASGYTDVRR